MTLIKSTTTTDVQKKNDPYSLVVHSFLDALEDNHLELAQNYLDDIFHHSSSTSLGYYCSGLLLLALEKPTKAISTLKKAVENTGDAVYYEYVEALAIVCARLGRDADALYYGKLAPSFESHPTFKNLIPAWLGKFEAALLSKQPLKATTDTWFRHGRHEQAIQELVDLLAFDPHHAETWSELIRFLEKEDRYADIISCSFALQDIRPLHSAEICLLAYALGINGQLTDAYHYLSPLIKNEHLQALETYHLLFLEAGAAAFTQSHLPSLDSPLKISSLSPDTKSFSNAHLHRQKSTAPFTIGLMAGDWHPFHLPSLIAPLFYSPYHALSLQKDVRVILINMSPQKTLHLSFLQNRFVETIDGVVDGQHIDPHTFATILHHTDIDLLIDLDGIASPHLSLCYHQNPSAAPVIAPLIRAYHETSLANPHLNILTDSIIHKNPTDNTFTPLDNHSLFHLSDRGETITKPTSPPFPLTIGMFANPCHFLHHEQALFGILKEINTLLPQTKLHFYTPKAGGMPATEYIASAVALPNLDITFSTPALGLMDFCRQCHVILHATPIITDCYPYAALLQSIPVLHLDVPEEPAVICSLLHAFHRKQWSFTQRADLLSLLGTWQDNPASYHAERQHFFQTQQDSQHVDTPSLCAEHLYHMATNYQHICSRS